MAEAAKTVQEVEFRYTTTGAEDAKRKAEGVGNALDNLSVSEGRSTAASEKAAKARERVAASQARMQRQIEAEARAIEQMRVAQEMYRQATEALTMAQQRAVAAQAEAGRAANDGTEAVSRQAQALQAAAKFAIQHPLLVAAGSAVAARSLGGLATTASGSLAAASLATAKYANDNLAMGGKVAEAATVASRALGGASTAAAAAGAGLTGFGDKIAGLGGSVGLLARGLSAVAPLFLPIAVGLAAFSAASASIDKAYADLAKLIALGQQAERLDISAPFLKAFTGLGAQFRIETEQMQAALQRASTLLQDRFGQASAASRVFGEVDPGGTLRANQQLALAQSTEERIRAVLAGMAELEARGQRLAAIKVGESVFGADLVERLRRGEQSVGRFVEELDSARSKEVLSQADVTRAVELEREIADVKRQIDEAVSATFDFSTAAVKLNEVWLGILKPVRDVAQTISQAVSGGDAATMRRIQDLQGRAQSIESVSIPRAVDRGDAAVVASLREQVAGLNAEADRLSMTMTSAAERIDSAVGRVPPPLRIMSDELAKLVGEAERSARSLDGTASAADNAGAAMSGAAVKARGFAEALASIQQANPNLSGTLGLLDRINKIQKDAAAGTLGLRDAFDAGLLSDEQTKARIERLNTEAAASIKALKTEAEKPFTGYVREAEIGKLDNLGQALARAGDRFAETRQKAASYYDLQIERATPETRGALEAEKVQALGKLDAAYKQVAATARKSASDQASADRGGSGADAYDNALSRARDQIKELALQAQTAGKATEEVIALTEANRLRRAADAAGRSGDAGVAEEIDKVSRALGRQRGVTDAAIEASARMKESTREIGQDLSRFAEDLLIGGGKIEDAFKSLTRTFGSGALNGLLTGTGPFASAFGTAPSERGQLGGLLGGQFSFGKLFDSKAIGDSLFGGAESGIGKALSEALKPQQAGGGFMSSKLGGGLLSVGAGAAVGYTSQSPFAGALAGGVAGLMTGNPLLGLAGAGAGCVGHTYPSKEKQHERRQRRPIPPPRRRADGQLAL